MTGHDYAMAAVIVLAAWCLTWIVRDKLREQRQTAWDHHADTAVNLPAHVDTELQRIVTDTPPYDDLAMARLRRDLDQWGAQ